MNKAYRFDRTCIPLLTAAFGSSDGIYQALLDFGSYLTVLRDPDRGKGVGVQTIAASQRGLTDLQHRTGIVPAHREVAYRCQQPGIDALVRQIRRKIHDELALAK